MRKRIGALGLAAVLLLAMICPALAANGTAELSVKGPEGPIKAGESFTVTVEIKDNPGFAAFQFTLGFDSEVLGFDRIETGTVLDGAMSDSYYDEAFGLSFGAISADNLTPDGVIANVSFTAKEDISALDLTFQVVIISDDQGDDLAYTVSDLGSTTLPAEPDDPGETAPNVPQPAPDPKPDPEPAPQPEPEPVKDISFTDTKGHWGEGYINRAAELGLFKGYPDGSFQPNLAVTRAQYVTVLYRMAGSPAVTSEAPFTDVSDQIQEFRTAIAWSYENGYLNGKGDGIFDPSSPVTRQEAMKILYGYAGGVSGMEILFTADYDAGFADSAELASWGKAPMYWGVFNSIISGTGDNMLSPQGTATRAQLAKILTVYFDRQNNK